MVNKSTYNKKNSDKHFLDIASYRAKNKKQNNITSRALTII